MIGSISEKVLIAVITAAILAVGSLLLNAITSGGIVRALGGVTKSELESIATLPASAVIALDSKEACPAPWKEFTALAGSFVRGAKDDEPKIMAGSMGGRNEAMLSTNNLPPHQHPIDAVLSGEAIGNNNFGWNNGGWWPGRVWIQTLNSNYIPTQGEKPNVKRSRKTEVQDGGPQAAIEILPTWYALRFCKI